MITTCHGVLLNPSLFPPATCGTDGAPLQSEKYLILQSNKRSQKSYKLPAPKLVQTTSEIQLTTFQQRQTILPDSSISNNCHVFMYLSPVDNRLSDIKEVHLFQPPYSFLSHLYPTIFFPIK